MNELKLALLGSEGVGKSGLGFSEIPDQTLHWRIRLEFNTSGINISLFTADSLYQKRLSIDGRQLNLVIFDPCSQNVASRCILEEPVDWADGFVVVYTISDRASFLKAESILHQIRESRRETCKGDVDVPVCLLGNKQDLCHSRQVSEEEGRSLALEHKCIFQEVSAAENYLDITNLFSRLIRHVMEHMKHRAERRRYSSSKSMTKLIINVFGKRRKSV